MSETELSLFGSLTSVAALFSTPCSGILLDVLGRKYSCILFGLPQVIAWTIISTCYRVEVVLIAMFISGLSGCIFLVVPVFICEFCDETIRGMMTSSAIIFYGLGMLLSYVLGGSLEYHTMNYAFLSLTVFGVVMLSFLKESPTHLMKKGLEKDAAKSVAFYRGEKVESKVVMQEIDNIRRSLNPQLEAKEDVTPEEEKLRESTEKVKLSFWRFIKKSRSTRRALLLCLILYTASIFQGLIVVQVYAQPLFKEAIPHVSTTISSVIFAIVVVVSGCMAGYLMEKAGRRFLMISSSLVAGFCCIVLGTQLQLHWGPYWISAIFLYTYCVAYSLGAGTVPLVLIAEVFLPEIKGIVTMIAFEWAWICNFIILFMFNPLMAVLGIGPIFYIFGSVAFATAIYCFSFLPETKGLTVDVIQTLFVKKTNANNV
ncbi:facilitated trehalose transporter Tret1-like isoform X2 [Pieris napi]|nr:facilitated trehalose transporter Tret1-like isoform X2 [Pieris napi]